MIRAAAVLAALAASGCLREGEERADFDRRVGEAEGAGVAVTVEDGLGHVRAIGPGGAEIWAQAPALELALAVRDGAGGRWRITVRNCMPGAELAVGADPEVAVRRLESPRPTVCRWRLELPAPASIALAVAPPDARRFEPWRFAVFGDVQTALDSVDEVFRAMNRDDELRFVMATGDLVEDGLRDEYALWFRELEVLDIPVFSTIGNHELAREPEPWRELIGRFNLHFRFKGVALSFVDSGTASIDPSVHDWLDSWLDDNVGRVHYFGTHYPPIDPVGVRSGSFRSRNEAAKLLARLAEGRVDATFYGHIHTFRAYENAGIPAFISGGGGAWPERLDGIGRHYLTVLVDPLAQTTDVRVVEIDD